MIAFHCMSCVAPQQVLRLHQHVAEAWHAKLRDVRIPPSHGNLRVKSAVANAGAAGADEAEPLSEEQAAEIERLLSDALSVLRTRTHGRCGWPMR